MRTINLTKNKQAIVDDEDYPILSKYKWCVSHYGYAVRREGKNIILMHRDIMKPTTGLQVDHINNDKLDNRRINLRICTQRENLLNRSVHKNNKLGIKGVRSHTTSNGRLRYSTRIDGRHIGSFVDLSLAVEAYKREELRLHGQFSKAYNQGVTA